MNHIPLQNHSMDFYTVTGEMRCQIMRHLLKEKRGRYSLAFHHDTVQQMSACSDGCNVMNIPEGSDVDLLVNFEQERSLLDQVGLIQDLEDLLGCRVDVVTEAGVHWYIRDRLRKEGKDSLDSCNPPSGHHGNGVSHSGEKVLGTAKLHGT